jgi:4-hydroxy-4-methyl-2-oxoglutarate aldolase
VDDALPPREEITARLYSAVLSDVLDSLGLTAQALRPFVRPLDESLVLFGRARTGLYMPRYHVEPGHNPYAVEIALVDDLGPGEVAVFACGGPTGDITLSGAVPISAGPSYR